MCDRTLTGLDPSASPIQRLSVLGWVRAEGTLEKDYFTHGKFTCAADSEEWPIRGGEYYEGQWRHDKWNGVGIKALSDGTLLQEGRWEDNKLAKPPSGLTPRAEPTAYEVHEQRRVHKVRREASARNHQMRW